MNQRCILFYNHLTFVYTYLHILHAYLNETKYCKPFFTVEREILYGGFLSLLHLLYICVY